MKPSELTDRAIDALRNYGWTQGTYSDVHNGFCMRGALFYAQRQCLSQYLEPIGQALLQVETGSIGQALLQVERSLKAACYVAFEGSGDIAGSIEFFNDKRVSSQDEAIGLLEKVRAGFEEVGQ